MSVTTAMSVRHAWVGVDIGGANLKASDGREHSVELAFPLWKSPESLSARLGDLLAPWPHFAGLAITMTAELADCYDSKSDGVQQLLTAAAQAAGGRPVQVWQTGGEFVDLEEARELVPLVAAANWHALATWVARSVPHGAALLADLGSTTLDLIPLQDGRPASEATTDVGRLASGELVYVGLRRTPLCALLQEVRLEGRPCGVMAEWFATTLDAGLLLGHLPPADCSLHTADGRPATAEHAVRRMAHMVGCDHTELSPAGVQSLAEQFWQAFVDRVRRALDRILQRLPPPSAIICSGEGSPLLQQILAGCERDVRPPIHDLSAMLGPVHSTAACAYALARLASERLEA